MEKPRSAQELLKDLHSKIESKFSGKKEEIAHKMGKSSQRLSPRMKEIRENNENARKSGLAIMAKDRHERRHNGKKGTSAHERQEWVKLMSKDN